VHKFVRTFLRHLAGKIELYRGDDLFLDKGIENQIHKVFENKVFLKSGAYLVIEPTEGLVVVDVNSGSFKKRLSPEESAFKVNMEAAVEVARQLRLRDLGGIIVIDFIDMEKEDHRRQVLNTLKTELSHDRAKYDILGISKFGLVEMTRERIHKTVHALSYQNCPYCQGRGKVKSPITMSMYATKELRRYLKTHRKNVVKLILNPEVATLVLADRKTLHLTEHKFRTKVELISNPALKLEDIEIV
jgi:ribonuclease G